MNISRDENKRFEKIAEVIKQTPRLVDVTISIEEFKKKKALAMVNDYIELYPKLFGLGFRPSAIMAELLHIHNISMMSFRNFIHREGIPMDRLKKMAAWSYRSKVKKLEEAMNERDKWLKASDTKDKEASIHALQMAEDIDMVVTSIKKDLYLL